jgi:predicted transcriptional regulator
MKVLLSIKPIFANKIFSGSKRYEFRRTIFKDKNVQKAIVYSSYPEQKVIGEFEIDSILFDKIDNLWNITKEHSGIDEKYFLEYFSDKEKGYAIKIKGFKRYRKPVDLRTHYGITPPQSFVYVKA